MDVCAAEQIMKVLYPAAKNERVEPIVQQFVDVPASQFQAPIVEDMQECTTGPRAASQEAQGVYTTATRRLNGGDHGHSARTNFRASC